MSITVEQLVNREVYYCVSQLVSHLLATSDNDREEFLIDLVAQDDYETPLLSELAMLEDPSGDKETLQDFLEYFELESTQEAIGNENNYQEYCEYLNIDPEQIEALEHWIVSDWLADRLLEKGEMVDKDIYGVVVWGRTCSGQAISADSVINEIYQELIKS